MEDRSYDMASRVSSELMDTLNETLLPVIEARLKALVTDASYLVVAFGDHTDEDGDAAFSCSQFIVSKYTDGDEEEFLEKAPATALAARVLQLHMGDACGNALRIGEAMVEERGEERQ